MLLNIAYYAPSQKQMHKTATSNMHTQKKTKNNNGKNWYNTVTIYIKR